MQVRVQGSMVIGYAVAVAERDRPFGGAESAAVVQQRYFRSCTWWVLLFFKLGEECSEAEAIALMCAQPPLHIISPFLMIIGSSFGC
jgi:hypothetical protein